MNYKKRKKIYGKHLGHIYIYIWKKRKNYIYIYIYGISINIHIIKDKWAETKNTDPMERPPHWGRRRRRRSVSFVSAHFLYYEYFWIFLLYSSYFPCIYVYMSQIFSIYFPSYVSYRIQWTVGPDMTEVRLLVQVDTFRVQQNDFLR